VSLLPLESDQHLVTVLVLDNLAVLVLFSFCLGAIGGPVSVLVLEKVFLLDANGIDAATGPNAAYGIHPDDFGNQDPCKLVAEAARSTGGSPDPKDASG